MTGLPTMQMCRVPCGWGEVPFAQVITGAATVRVHTIAGLTPFPV